MAKAKHAESPDAEFGTMGFPSDAGAATSIGLDGSVDHDDAVNSTDSTGAPVRRRRTPEEFHAEYGYYLADETKSQKFTRVASRRVSAVIDALRTLPQLGAKQTYECTEEQATKMWDTIHEEFKKNVAEFERVQVGGYAAREKSFTF